MTRLIFLSIIALTSQLVIGQSNSSKNEKIEQLKAQKVAFLTEQIGLSCADAQNFWPVYNEYSNIKDSLSSARYHERNMLKNNSATLSNKEKEKSIDKQIQLKWEEEQLEFNYHKKFKEILTIDQVIRLYDAEHTFKMRLIRQIRELKAEFKQDSNVQSSSLN